MEPKGLILAGAGLERQSSPMDRQRTPHMLPVANKPIMLHALESMATAGISDVAIAVAADTEESVAEAAGAATPWGMRVSYTRIDGWAGVGSALLAAESWLDGHPFVVQHGDGLIRHGLGSLLEAVEDDEADALLLMQDPAEAGEPGGAMSSRLRAEDDDRRQGSRLTMTGVQIFGPGFLRRAAGHIRDGEPAADLASLAAELARLPVRVRVRRIEGWRRFDGDPEVLLEMNRLVLEDLDPGPAMSVPGCRVEGRVSIHPAARVESSVIRGPVVIGPNVEIQDAYVGPYTAIGDGARIECAEIENSIVFPGAAVLRVSPRLESCVIGREARVERDFLVPRGLRLHIGDSASVLLG